jgi:hypothetical protein
VDLNRGGGWCGSEQRRRRREGEGRGEGNDYGLDRDSGGTMRSDLLCVFSDK